VAAFLGQPGFHHAQPLVVAQVGAQQPERQHADQQPQQGSSGEALHAAGSGECRSGGAQH
jgi:hypothetical protein